MWGLPELLFFPVKIVTVIALKNFNSVLRVHHNEVLIAFNLYLPHLRVGTLLFALETGSL